MGIQNPSSTDKDWNPIFEIRNPWRGIQNPRLSLYSLSLIWGDLYQLYNHKSDVKVQAIYAMKQKVSFLKN